MNTITSGPLRILPPLGKFGFRCQAAIPVTARCPTQQRAFHPLPGWRYCSWCSEQLDGLTLCGRHRPMAEKRGIERLLPRLQSWDVPR